MKDYIKSVINPKLNLNDNLNMVREYLQAYFLYVVYKTKLYQNLVFTGGTALRFIYKIRRFSEDIDFSLSAKAKGYDFNDMVRHVQQEFRLAGYDLEIKSNSEQTVHKAFLKFSGILYETGLSKLKSQKIMIKVEIDSNPPKGGIEENTTYNSTFTFYMLHYSLESLFAGKVNALLCREYTKGRDWYDLMWYLTKFKGIEPNYIMLNNGMAQARKETILMNRENWKEEIKKVVTALDWAKVKNDVGRFLEDQTDLELLTPQVFTKLLE